MKAKLFDGTEITFNGEDVKSVDFEIGDYSILIRFNKPYSKETGYICERVVSISI